MVRITTGPVAAQMDYFLVRPEPAPRAYIHLPVKIFELTVTADHRISLTVTAMAGAFDTPILLID
jgi:hypothetical protein